MKQSPVYHEHVAIAALCRRNALTYTHPLSIIAETSEARRRLAFARYIREAGL